MNSPLTWERRAQRELPPDPSDAGEVDRILELDQRFLVAHPDWRRPGRTKASWSRTALTAAALLLSVAIPAVLLPSDRPAAERQKGTAETLLVYHRLGDANELLSPSTRLEAGQQIQLAYRSPDAEYGAILSIDGRGSVTRHFPLDSDRAAVVRSPQAHLLPYAYTLDDAPDYELFVFLTAETSFPVAEAEALVRALGPLPPEERVLPQDIHAVWFPVLKKETLR